MVHTKKSKESVVLKVVGFFRELPHGLANEPSLKNAIRDTAGEHEEDVVRYLESGVVFIASPGIVRDVLNERGPIGSGTVHTDGVWAWPDDLAYYVSHYHVALPKDFVAHAERNHWKAPEISRQQLRLLALP